MQNEAIVRRRMLSSGQPCVGIRRTSDEALVDGIRAGNSVAMQVLFARYHVRTYRFILRMVGNAATAEDLASDVFVTVWRHAGQFKARSSVSTWLLAIARFKALAELRRKYRVERRLRDQPAEDCTAETPEQGLQAGDRRRIVQKCLMRLSREHRTIIDLVYYHERSVQEVAEIVGIPSNTVKTRMYYARQKLAKLLEGEGVIGVASEAF